MLENVSNTDPKKVICEDTLSERIATYGGLREDAFRVAHSLRTAFQLGPDDTVSIISRSCVRTIRVPPLVLPRYIQIQEGETKERVVAYARHRLTLKGGLYPSDSCDLGGWGDREVRS